MNDKEFYENFLVFADKILRIRDDVKTKNFFKLDWKWMVK